MQADKQKVTFAERKESRNICQFHLFASSTLSEQPALSHNESRRSQKSYAKGLHGFDRASPIGTELEGEFEAQPPGLTRARAVKREYPGGNCSIRGCSLWLLLIWLLFDSGLRTRDYITLEHTRLGFCWLLQLFLVPPSEANGPPPLFIKVDDDDDDDGPSRTIPDHCQLYSPEVAHTTPPGTLYEIYIVGEGSNHGIYCKNYPSCSGPLAVCSVGSSPMACPASPWASVLYHNPGTLARSARDSPLCIILY
jgi:hypothetical protein